jgi:hypothetical protein
VTHQLAAAPCNDDPVKAVKVSSQLLKGVQQDDQGATINTSVYGGLDVPGFVDNDDVQTDRTEIDPYIAFGTCHDCPTPVTLFVDGH